MKFDLSGMDLSIQKVLKWTLPFYKNDQDGKRKGWETRRNTGASLISHQEMRKREPTDCKKKRIFESIGCRNSHFLVYTLIGF